MTDIQARSGQVEAWPALRVQEWADTRDGQFLLPYEVVRTAPDPEHTLLAFLQTTYEAAAERGGRDRLSLEDDLVRRAGP